MYVWCLYTLPKHVFIRMLIMLFECVRVCVRVRVCAYVVCVSVYACVYMYGCVWYLYTPSRHVFIGVLIMPQGVPKVPHTLIDFQLLTHEFELHFSSLNMFFLKLKTVCL